MELLISKFCNNKCILAQCLHNLDQDKAQLNTGVVATLQLL